MDRAFFKPVTLSSRLDDGQWLYVPMSIVTRDDLIEEILSHWRDAIGADFPGYRGHVYRVFNFCLALHHPTEDQRAKLAIAACFHDIGLWSAKTVDYIPPSMEEAGLYLQATGRESWSGEIARMIEMHHKVRSLGDENLSLAEWFRRGDLVDFSLGWITFGLPWSLVRQVKKTIPNQRFHWFLLKGAFFWFVRHPFRPPPFMRW
jgi:hypothetical protein